MTIAIFNRQCRNLLLALLARISSLAVFCAYPAAQPLHHWRYPYSPQILTKSPMVTRVQGNRHVDPELNQKLDCALSVSFQETPLEEVLRSISNVTRVEIVANQADLRGNLSIHLEQIPLRSLLRVILAQFDLRYQVEGSRIRVTRHQRRLIKRSYDVSSLLESRKGDGPFAFNTASQAHILTPQRADGFDDLVEFIEQTVSPNSWSCVGGAGSIEPDVKSFTLIINQTEEVHDETISAISLLRLKNAQNSTSISLCEVRSSQVSIPHEISSLGSPLLFVLAIGSAFVLLRLRSWLHHTKGSFVDQTAQGAYGEPIAGGEASPYRRLLVALWACTAGVVALAAWLLVQPAWQRYRLVHELTEAIDSERVPDVVTATTAIISRGFGRTCVPALVERLSHKNDRVRILACDTLSWMGSDAEYAVPFLANLLQYKAEDVSEAAAMCLGEIGPAAHAAIPQLIERIESERWDRVFQPPARGHCATAQLMVNGYRVTGYNRPHALVRIGPSAVPALTQALADERATVRCGAAALLGQFGNAANDAVPRLRELLEDDHEYVRLAAARAVRSIVGQSESVVNEVH